jgi:hypothetical protein
MKVSLTIINQIKDVDKQIAALINKCPDINQLHRKDLMTLHDLQLKMKFHAKYHPAEFHAFREKLI